MKYREIIFSLYGAFEKRVDSFKRKIQPLPHLVETNIFHSSTNNSVSLDSDVIIKPSNIDPKIIVIEYLSANTFRVLIKDDIENGLQYIFNGGTVGSYLTTPYADIKINSLRTSGEFFIGYLYEYGDMSKVESIKGLNERFNEIIGMDIDMNLKPKMQYLIDNLLVPAICLPQYVPYIESQLGFNKDLNTLYLSSSLNIRRKVVQHIHKYYSIKGTRYSLELMFSMIGLTAVITESYGDFGFDSPLTFDDQYRRFDSFCPPCSRYSIDLSGPFNVLSPEQVAGILSIVKFNEPINAQLEKYSYNGGNLVNATITINTLPNGDLAYDNVYDPNLTLWIDVNGDLKIDGPMKNHYSINSNGDLIFTV